MNSTIVVVDLAKNVIQVCTVKNNKSHSNVQMSSAEFSLWLANSEPSTIVFEACGTSNYWKQRATECGHNAQLISARLVSSVRQGQKSDKNDAIAIAQAARLAKVNFVSGKKYRPSEIEDK